jgi:hypothetical protein
MHTNYYNVLFCKFSDNYRPDLYDDYRPGL